MKHKFHDLVDEDLAPGPENHIFPDRNDTEGIQRLIDRRDGVDITCGGIRWTDDQIEGIFRNNVRRLVGGEHRS